MRENPTNKPKKKPTSAPTTRCSIASIKQQITAQCNRRTLRGRVQNTCVPLEKTKQKGVDACELNKKLAIWKKIRPFVKRVQAIATYFKNKQIPYPQKWKSVSNAKLSIDFTTLDCTRFAAYYVMALAQSNNFGEFLMHLRKLTYRNNQLSKQNEMHYATEWANAAVRNRYFNDITKTLGVRTKTRQMRGKSIHNQPAIQLKSDYIPSDSIQKVAAKLQTGDLILLARNWRYTIIGHMGLIIKKGNNVYLRHSTNTGPNKGSVVDVPLDDYIDDNDQFIGIRVLRPKKK